MAPERPRMKTLERFFLSGFEKYFLIAHLYGLRINLRECSGLPCVSRGNTCPKGEVLPGTGRCVRRPRHRWRHRSAVPRSGCRPPSWTGAGSWKSFPGVKGGHRFSAGSFLRCRKRLRSPAVPPSCPCAGLSGCGGAAWRNRLSATGRS